MALEQFKNDSKSPLSGGIDNSQTTLTVDDGSQFPSVGNFRLKIDDELLLCTGRSSNTLTVTRGVEGTSGASHSDDAVVAHVLTAGSLDARRSDDFLVDTFANRPAAGRAGALFLPSDGNILYRDTGTAWRGIAVGREFVSPPAVSNWTWVNQGGASAVDEFGTIRLTDPAHSGQDWRVLVRSAPSTPYVITAVFQAGIVNTSTEALGGWFGPMFRESATGELSGICYLMYNGTNRLGIRSGHWSGPTGSISTIGTDYVQTTLTPAFGNLFYLRISDDGTNRKHWFSFDGVAWFEQFSEGRTTFLTADQVGFALNMRVGATSQAFDSFIRLLSWEVE